MGFNIASKLLGVSSTSCLLLKSVSIFNHFFHLQALLKCLCLANVSILFSFAHFYNVLGPKMHIMQGLSGKTNICHVAMQLVFGETFCCLVLVELDMTMNT